MINYGRPWGQEWQTLTIACGRQTRPPGAETPSLPRRPPWPYSPPSQSPDRYSSSKILTTYYQWPILSTRSYWSCTRTASCWWRSTRLVLTNVLLHNSTTSSTYLCKTFLRRISEYSFTNCNGKVLHNLAQELVNQCIKWWFTKCNCE